MAPAAATHEHYLRPGFGRDVGRQARAAAMMRRHEHVTRPWVGLIERLKCRAFEITGQEHATSCCFDRKHEARFVVGPKLAGRAR
jgi:hypothetical protein